MTFDRLVETLGNTCTPATNFRKADVSCNDVFLVDIDYRVVFVSCETCKKLSVSVAEINRFGTCHSHSSQVVTSQTHDHKSARVIKGGLKME